MIVNDVINITLIIMKGELPYKPSIISFKERLSEAEKILLDKTASITRNPIGLRNEKGDKGSPLSPEDFELARNNFHFFFYEDDGKEFNVGRIYRKKKSFQQWRANDLERVQKLVDELSKYQFRRMDLDKNTNQLVRLPDDPRGPEMERKLYEAYLQIREYVDDDRILFK